MKNLPLAARNLGRAFWRGLVNRVRKHLRQGWRRVQRASRHVGKGARRVRVRLRHTLEFLQDAGVWTRRGAVRVGRYGRKWQETATSRLRRDLSVRRELRIAARGGQPIIAGPWLSEVGFEALYWTAFLRWFCDRYRVPASRVVVLSRGGVASWYAGLADRYVEILDLVPPDEFAALNAARQHGADQKQRGVAGLDEEILRRVRGHRGLESATICHPSAMFRLLGPFWLGNESLEYLQAHLSYAPLAAPPLPAGLLLPERFTAIKFYAGKALPPTDDNYQRLRAIVERIAARTPVVSLETGLALDEHRDFGFRDVPGVLSVAERLTPQSNLAVQSAIIGRADVFVGTCGSLAWLAPQLGTPTVGVYSDDELLTPHLYAARCAYRAMAAAPFAALDLQALAHVDPMRYAAAARTVNASP